MNSPASEPRPLAILIRADSPAPSQNAFRVPHGHQPERVSAQAKLHVITQFREAQQSARIAGLANRVSQILPIVKKSIARNQRRVVRLTIKFQ